MNTHLKQQTHTSRDESEDSGKPQLYNRLKLLRQDAEISRKQLAQDLSITLATLGNLERGTYEPGLLLAWRIGTYFDMELEAIFSSRPLPPLAQALRLAQTPAHPEQAACRTASLD